MSPSKTSSARSVEAGNDACWDAVVTRGQCGATGIIVGVRTTGIYCRTSCPARRPKRQNVTFYETVAHAKAAGFRACLRCKPDDVVPGNPHLNRVAEACARITDSEAELNLTQLAEDAALSPFYFHRVFKATTGLTPRAYGEALRQRRVHESLIEAATVTEAIFAAGYQSASRFYAASETLLGMTPRALRARGQGQRIWFAIGACSLGSILVGSTAKGICTIDLGDDAGALLGAFQQRFAKAELIGGDTTFEALVAMVVGWVEAGPPPFPLPFDIAGTIFQHRVWRALRAVPWGTTASYQEIARLVGQERASRAVARACGANPVAIAIPCHRVVRMSGDVSGYRWGVARKIKLLERERKG